MRLFLLALSAVTAPAAAQQVAPPPRGDSAPGAIEAPRVAPPDSGARAGRARVYRLGPPGDFAYTRPGWTEFARNIPRDELAAGRAALRRDNLPMWGLIAGTTLALVAVDQPIFDEARRFGRQIHLSTSTDMTTLARVPILGFKAPLQVPANLSSGIYFLGDGWSSMLLAGGFLTYGAIARDNRALRTTSEITESLIGLALVTQTLKHVAGRESPEDATARGGQWRPFTKLSTYNKNVSHYDAMPSGHLATMMATVTVVSLNYPEHRWIAPVGYSVIGLVGYQMINNGVHWAGDYPLALAIGGAFGRIAVDRGRTRLTSAGDVSGVAPSPSRPSVLPLVSPQGVGLQMRYSW